MPKPHFENDVTYVRSCIYNGPLPNCGYICPRNYCWLYACIRGKTSSNTSGSVDIVQIWQIWRFFNSRKAMLARIIAVVVCLCVFSSVTRRYCIKMAKRRITQKRHVNFEFEFWHVKSYHWHNHPCQIFRLSVWGFWSFDIPNLAPLHKNSWSPLQ